MNSVIANVACVNSFVPNMRGTGVKLKEMRAVVITTHIHNRGVVEEVKLLIKSQRANESAIGIVVDSYVWFNLSLIVIFRYFLQPNELIVQISF